MLTEPTCLAGPLLPANTPLGIVTSNGSYVRTDGVDNPAVAGSGDGSSKPEQYSAVDPANPNSVNPIKAGQTTVIKSAQTGLYCRLASVNEAGEMGMICDQESSSTATPFTYTGSGLAVNGIPMVQTTPGGPLVLANSTRTPLTATSDDLTFPAVGEWHLGLTAHPRAQRLPCTEVLRLGSLILQRVW